MVNLDALELISAIVYTTNNLGEADEAIKTMTLKEMVDKGVIISTDATETLFGMNLKIPLNLDGKRQIVFVEVDCSIKDGMEP